MADIVSLSEEQWQRLQARAESLADTIMPILVQEPPVIAMRAVECLIAKVMDATPAEASLRWNEILQEVLASFESMDRTELGAVS
jgi:hypothetical protein